MELFSKQLLCILFQLIGLAVMCDWYVAKHKTLQLLVLHKDQLYILALVALNTHIDSLLWLQDVIVLIPFQYLADRAPFFIWEKIIHDPIFKIWNIKIYNLEIAEVRNNGRAN